MSSRCQTKAELDLQTKHKMSDVDSDIERCKEAFQTHKVISEDRNKFDSMIRLGSAS
jgi:hypothetical protein